MKSFLFCLLGIALYQLAFSQNNIDYYTIPGLVVSSGNGNFYDVDKKAGVYYDRKVDDVEGSKVYFRGTKSHYESVLLFKDNKIFSSTNVNGFQLYFDFNLNAGDTIKAGTFNNNVIDSITTIKLLNGEVRPKYVLRNLSVYFPGDITYFVPGLGDLRYGFFPYRSFEGSTYFICAKNGQDLLWVNQNVANLCEPSTCIHPFPDFDMGQNYKTISCTNKTKYANSFIWHFGDGKTSQDVNPVHTYENPGCYTVKISATNNCLNGKNSDSLDASICSGMGWEKVTKVDSFHILFNTQTPGGIRIMGGGNVVHSSNDNGQSWSKFKILQNGKPRYITELLMWNDSAGVLITDYNNSKSDANKSIFITKDGGRTWTETGPLIYYLTDIELGQKGEVYGVEGNYRKNFYRSLDYGNTWEIFTLNQNDYFWNIIYVNKDTVMAHGYDKFPDYKDYILSVSLNKGKTWKTSLLPPSLSIKGSRFFTAKSGYGWSDNGYIYKTVNGGVKWDFVYKTLKYFDPNFYNEKLAFIYDEYSTIDKTIYFTKDGFQFVSTTNCNFDSLTNVSIINDTLAYSYTYYNNPASTQIWKFNPTLLGDCIQLSDIDGDGFYSDMDCNDNNVLINPAAMEVPYNGEDDDCNSVTQDDDIDGDGFMLANDCNDMDAFIYPDAIEITNNGIDENCDGVDNVINGTSTFQNQAALKIAPNPVSDKIRLIFSQDRNDKVTIIINDVLGKVCLQKTKEISGLYCDIDVNDFKSGLYFITVSFGNGGTYNKSFVIVK